MSSKSIAGLLAAGAVLPAAVLASQAAGGQGKDKTVSCTYTLRNQSPPSHKTGFDLGFVRCGKPFGRGLYYGAFNETITPPTAGATGTTKQYFDAGTVHGTYSFKGMISANLYRGKLIVLGGSGAFKRTAGSLTLTCSLHPQETTCSGSGTFKGL